MEFDTKKDQQTCPDRARVSAFSWSGDACPVIPPRAELTADGLYPEPS